MDVTAISRHLEQQSRLDADNSCFKSAQASSLNYGVISQTTPFTPSIPPCAVVP